ncbi:MAG: tRNA (N6-isopentenyl adenosine(37)-C2)-methylthiotransferase MiaB [Desulfobacteraceae bacterium]|jgi:tRNA-2-methylthio-N6-dimethylallyladenosine synthase
MTTKRLFINTMGCQMNVYDSGQIQSRLAPMGYSPTEALEQADLIIVNTCTIRDKAEQKAFSFLGRLASLKQRNPGLIIGMGGCVAQQEGRRVLKRMPHVDLVFGTHAIGRLPQIIQRIQNLRCRVVDIDISETISPDDFIPGPFPRTDASAFVTIMRGCDNYCTYCIVPYVRGRESSRPMDDIITEIRRLVDNGVREVTLLGQNVNSYGQKEGYGSFAWLLEQVHGVELLERIRFTTSHPKDLSSELICSFRKLDKLCRHIHLPVQSGSNRILKRMNRRYTREQYVDKVRQLRRVCPDIAITSDIIVGFPGETQQDFHETMSLIDEIGYDGLFAFIYSDRPNARAVRFQDKVEDAVKKERLQSLLAWQGDQTLRKNRALVGTVQQILVDGFSDQRDRREPGQESDSGNGTAQWTGRTSTNKIVHFVHAAPHPSDNQMLTGQLLRIMIEEALPHCLVGRPL